MNEPERPGKIIPLTLIIPHKKTKIKLSFSFAGSNKLIINPIVTPIRTNKIFLLDLKLTNFLRWKIVPITNPKKDSKHVFHICLEIFQEFLKLKNS